MNCSPECIATYAALVILCGKIESCHRTYGDKEAANADRLVAEAAVRALPIRFVSEAVDEALKFVLFDAAETRKSALRSSTWTSEAETAAAFKKADDADKAVSDAKEKSDPWDVLSALAPCQAAFRTVSANISVMHGEIVGQASYNADRAAHPENEYIIEIGDGYFAILRRNGSWNVYIRVPEGHFITKPHPGTTETSYRAAGVLDLSCTDDELMSQTLSDFGVPCTYHRGREVGLDHHHNYDFVPGGGYRDHRVRRYYTTFEGGMKEALEMKAAFKNMCATCGKQATTFCAKCKIIAYCDETCQKADFATHTMICSDS